MVKSTWKSAEEIRFSLGGARRVAVFACGTCANLSNAGGPRGLKYIRGLIDSWGIEVSLAKCLATCCPEESMKSVVRRYSSRLNECDALVMLSCSGGVKAAFLAGPGVPVIAALDTVGSVPVSVREDPVAASVCTSCEHCVISFTGGICPISRCPAKSPYGPCRHFTEETVTCEIDHGVSCVWREIYERGDPAMLERLSEIHRSGEYHRLSPAPRRHSPAWLRRMSGWFVSRVRGFARLVPFIN